MLSHGVPPPPLSQYLPDGSQIFAAASIEVKPNIKSGNF
jgi:hypothetical protein